MFTKGIPWALTITAVMVISAEGTPAKSLESGPRADNLELNAASQAVVSDIAAPAEAALGKALAGTWVVNVDQPGFPPSQRHFSFNSDGGLVTNDDLQVGPNFVEHQSIGQGNWIRTGNRSVAAIIVGQRFNLQGTFLGTYKVRMDLKLNERMSEWSASFRIDIILPGGQVIFTSDGAFEATRLEVEPL